MLRIGKFYTSATEPLNAIGKVLSLIGYKYLSRNAVYMLYPNDPSRSEGNRHYLYTPSAGWSNAGTLSAGVMAATGVISDGGTFSYTTPAACVMDCVVTWENGGSPVSSFIMGFNRNLSAGEKAALSVSAFWSLLFAGTAIDVGDCSIEFRVPLLTRSTDSVNVAGRYSLETTGNFGGYSVGDKTRPYADIFYKQKFRQNTTMTSVSFYLANRTNFVSLSVEVWRFVSGTTYARVFTEDVTARIADGANTITLNTPFAALENDVYGLTLVLSGTNGTCLCAKEVTGSDVRYINGAQSTPSNFASWSTLGYVLPMLVNGQAPLLVAVGDSITARFSSFITTSAPSSFTSSYLAKLKGLDARFISQNMGINSNTTTLMEARFDADCVALRPRFCIIQGGVNDIATGATKATYLAKMGSMLDKCVAANIIPIVCCIMPWTNGSNANLITRDGFTADLKALLIASYPTAICVDFDSVLGQERSGGSPTPTAGNKWNLQAAYDAGDGVHPSEAGNAVIAAEILRMIGTKYILA